MNKKEAKEIFEKIRKEYDQIPYPKYLNANPDDLQKQYDLLREMEEFLKDDFSYAKLINSFSQTITRLNRKGTWINTSERGMNKAIPPVIKKSNQDFFPLDPFEWESEKSGQICSITNGYWDAKNYMVMDVVGYFYLLKEGGDCLPEIIAPIFNDVESIRKRELELDVSNENKSNSPMMIREEDLSTIRKQKYYVKFDDHQFRKFTGLDLSSNDILNLLLRTSLTEFKITYPVRMVREKGKKMEEKWYSMNIFSRPFEMGYINQDIRKDGIVQSRSYYIVFNTILGEMFVHNLMTKNYDWISNNLYHLPPSAQIFYRHFLLHHDYPQTQLNLSTIKEKMKFQDSNITNLIANLEINTLNPLERNGLILSYEKTDGINGIKYIINLPKKGDHDNGKTGLLQQTEATCISERDVGSGKEGWGVRKTETEVSG